MASESRPRPAGAIESAGTPLSARSISDGAGWRLDRVGGAAGSGAEALSRAGLATRAGVGVARDETAGRDIAVGTDPANAGPGVMGTVAGASVTFGVGADAVGDGSTAVRAPALASITGEARSTRRGFGKGWMSSSAGVAALPARWVTITRVAATARSTRERPAGRRDRRATGCPDASPGAGTTG